MKQILFIALLLTVSCCKKVPDANCTNLQVDKAVQIEVYKACLIAGHVDCEGESLHMATKCDGGLK